MSDDELRGWVPTVGFIFTGILMVALWHFGGLPQ
jgi:hypothetical protein